MDDRLMILEARILKLERRNRSVLMGLAALIGIFALGFTLHQSSEEKVLSAERFALIDAQGRVRAELLLREQQPVFLLKDENGRDRLEIKHDADESGFFIRDETGTIRIGAAQFAHGGGGFALHGPDSKGAAVLYYKNRGSLSFYDETGGTTLRLPEANK